MIHILVLLTTILFAKEPIDYKTKISMDGLYLDSNTNKARVVGFKFSGEINYLLLSNLTTHLKGGIAVQGGSSESVFTSDYAPRNSFFLSDGYLKYDPLNKLLMIEFGAIGQGRYKSPLLVGGAAFPAIIESSEVKWKNFTLGISLQQSIANAQTHTTRIDEVDEGTPLFFFERIGGSYKDKKFETELHFSHFRFDNLSRGVAWQSQFYHNLISGIKDSAQFTYGYEGYQSDISFSYELLPSWQVSLKINYLFNDKAPNGDNEGYLLALNNKIMLANTILILEGGLFRNEANTSVAYYNSNNFGHNNGKGFFLFTECKLPEKELSAQFGYSRIEILDVTDYQSDAHKFTLSLAKEF